MFSFLVHLGNNFLKLKFPIDERINHISFLLLFRGPSYMSGSWVSTFLAHVQLSHRPLNLFKVFGEFSLKEFLLLNLLYSPIKLIPVHLFEKVLLYHLLDLSFTWGSLVTWLAMALAWLTGQRPFLRLKLSFWCRYYTHLGLWCLFGLSRGNPFLWLAV